MNVASTSSARGMPGPLPGSVADKQEVPDRTSCSHKGKLVNEPQLRTPKSAKGCIKEELEEEAEHIEMTVSLDPFEHLHDSDSEGDDQRHVSHIKVEEEEHSLQSIDHVNVDELDVEDTEEGVACDPLSLHVDGGVKNDSRLQRFQLSEARMKMRTDIVNVENPIEVSIIKKYFGVTATTPCSTAVQNSAGSASSSISRPGKREKEKLFECTECAKTFINVHKLRRHFMIHTGEKPHTCPLCNRSFQHSWVLKRHLLLHTGEKPFSCNQCGARFTQKGNLDSHQRVHLNERPFKCEFCGKTYISSSSLSLHVRSHEDVKPFECTSCGMAFAGANSLKRHVLTHTGEKPYPCTVCGKCFTQNFSLSMHMRTHTKENPFECAFCNKTFRHKVSWKRHTSMHTALLRSETEESGRV